MCTYTSSRVKRKGFYVKNELHMFLLFDTFLGRFPEVNILSKYIFFFLTLPSPLSANTTLHLTCVYANLSTCLSIKGSNPGPPSCSN